MDRDMASVSMLRKRYENFMHQPNVRDKKMRDLLLVSPINPQATINIEEVRHEDIHAKNTRLNEEKIEALKKKKEEQNRLQDKEIEVNLLERENTILRQLEGFRSDLRVSCEDGEVFVLPVSSIEMLRTVEVDLSDNLIITCL